VPGYLGGLCSKRFNPQAKIQTLHESPTSILLDADNALGYLPTWLATHAAVERARTTGVAVAGTRNGNEFGRAAFYAEEIGREGMIGIVCGNTLPMLGAPGAGVATFGNNPLAFSAPGAAAPLFDAAFTPRSGGELMRRRLLNLSLPEEWGYRDAAGEPVSDPHAVGGVMPAVGGAKGFGLAILVDLLAGVLTGAASGPDVPRDNSHIGSFVLALQPDIFGGAAELDHRLTRAADAVRESGGRMPGDSSRAHRRHAVEAGVTIPAPIFDLFADAVGTVDQGIRAQLDGTAIRSSIA
jgi:LDH2 family malate/lactate/ureidoglycolate dehydrogenase